MENKANIIGEEDGGDDADADDDDVDDDCCLKNQVNRFFDL